MEIIFFVVGIVGLILIFSAIGLIIEKVRYTRLLTGNEEENIFILTKYLFLKHPFYITLSIFAFAIIQSGFQNILNSFNMNEDTLISLSSSISVTLLILSAYFLRKRIYEYNTLKNAMRCLISVNPNLLSDLKRAAQLDQFWPKRDIPLSLFLEDKGVFYPILQDYPTFKRTRKDILDGLGSTQDKSFFNDLISLIYNIKEFKNGYRILLEYDYFLSKHLKEYLKNDYPEQFYFFRLNALQKFYFSLKDKRWPKYNEEEFQSEDGPAYKLAQLILNEFLKNNEKYEDVPVSLSNEEITRYFETPPHKEDTE